MNKLKEIFQELRSLDPNDPGRWPLGVRVGTVAMLFLFTASAGYWYFVWKSQRPRLLEARATEQQLWETLETKAKKASNLDAYKAQLAEMEKSFGTMLRQLPNKTEVPNLLVDISQTGLAAGLEEQLFQPVGEIRKDFYAELPIKIRLTGDYHEMGAFASGIAALPRIVTLHDIEIKPEGKGGDGLLTLDVVAKTYRYLDDDEQGAQSEADDPKGNKKPARSKKPAKKKDAKSKGDSA
jgi:type IV pilus assembly protein PilO